MFEVHYSQTYPEGLTGAAKTLTEGFGHKVMQTFSRLGKSERRGGKFLQSGQQCAIEGEEPGER
jgi:hypothetical protein